MKKLRIIGLALVAVLAVSAVVASAASAKTYKSEIASPNKTFVTGANEGNHVFKAGATVECTGATGEGSFVTGATSLTTSNVAYSGCKVAGQAATVKMNGCNYKFGEPTGEASPFTIKTITIEGASCTEIVVTATTAGCTIKVKPQTTTGTTTATNNAATETAKKTVTVNANISNITSTSSGGICGTAGTTSTATYTGKFKVSGFSERSEKKEGEKTIIEHKGPTGIEIG